MADVQSTGALDSLQLQALSASGTAPPALEDQEVQERGSDQVQDKKPKKVEKHRLCVLDNAKFILNICVAMEHLAGPCFGCDSHSFMGAFGLGIKMFMMPTWTFISGYCSSTDLSNVRKVDGCIKVIAIYLLSQLFWLLMSRYADPWYSTTKWGMELRGDGNPFQGSWKVEDWIIPFWQLWYLRDLAVWRVVLPFWARLKYPLISAWVVSSVIDSFYLYGETYDQGRMNTWLQLNMIWMYFPLYYLGTIAKERKWELQEGIWYRIAGLIVFGACVAIPIFEPQDMNSVWRFSGHSSTIASLTGTGALGNLLQCVIRLLSYLVIAASICSFMHIIPRGSIPVMTSFGERSLVNYIFHPLSGMLLSYVGVYGGNYEGATPPAWAPPVRILLTILTSVFWMSPWVWHVVWPICDPPIHLLLKPQTAGGTAAEQAKPTRLAAFAASARACFGCMKKHRVKTSNGPKVEAEEVNVQGLVVHV